MMISIPRPIRRVLRALRHTPDRLLHRFRRRRNQEDLGRIPIPGTVLFICYGNICRSPYAAELFQRALSEPLAGRIQTISAGLFGDGRHSPEMAIEVAQRRGIDLTAHRSTLIRHDIVARSELIVVMSREHAVWIRGRFRVHWDRFLILGDLDPLAIETRTITDPYGGSSEVFEESYGRIDRCLGELIGALASGSGTRTIQRADVAIGPVP